MAIRKTSEWKIEAMNTGLGFCKIVTPTEYENGKNPRKNRDTFPAVSQRTNSKRLQTSTRIKRSMPDSPAEIHPVRISPLMR
jgi:hypothetical protein